MEVHWEVFEALLLRALQVGAHKRLQEEALEPADVRRPAVLQLAEPLLVHVAVAEAGVVDGEELDGSERVGRRLVRLLTRVVPVGNVREHEVLERVRTEVLHNCAVRQYQLVLLEEDAHRQ